ncbi:hypothetical protein AcW1_002552 [Taiwanofungus camphoratus]|nr:hypothetical protein AcW1_002552 [Antrodia cinnamomea]
MTSITTSKEKESAKDSSIMVESTFWLYFRLGRMNVWPAGTILFFWSNMWGTILSAYTHRLQPKQIAIQAVIYLVASTFRHVAACVWNDICDRDFDRQVERTKNRPIASGKVSVPNAILFTLINGFIYILILSFCGDAAVKIGLLGLFTFEAIYPLAKRFSNWPQAYLGVDIAWGLPIAWAVNNESMNWHLVTVLVLGSTCWTIHYDTIYACQDRTDDLQAGVRSCALLFGDYVRPICACFASVFVLSLAYVGMLNGQGPVYFVIVVGGTVLHFIWQFATLDLNNGPCCQKIWKSNCDLGYLICGGMLADYAYMLTMT